MQQSNSTSSSTVGFAVLDKPPKFITTEQKVFCFNGDGALFCTDRGQTPQSLRKDERCIVLPAYDPLTVSVPLSDRRMVAELYPECDDALAAFLSLQPVLNDARLAELVLAAIRECLPVEEPWPENSRQLLSLALMEKGFSCTDLCMEDVSISPGLASFTEVLYTGAKRPPTFFPMAKRIIAGKLEAYTVSLFEAQASLLVDYRKRNLSDDMDKGGELLLIRRDLERCRQRLKLLSSLDHGVRRGARTRRRIAILRGLADLAEVTGKKAELLGQTRSDAAGYDAAVRDMTVAVRDMYDFLDDTLSKEECS